MFSLSFIHARIFQSLCSRSGPTLSNPLCLVDSHLVLFQLSHLWSAHLESGMFWRKRAAESLARRTTTMPMLEGRSSLSASKSL